MTHQEDPYIHQCDEDIDFQFSSSYAQCHWTIPDALQPFITHVKWTLEEEEFDGELCQFDILQWIFVFGVILYSLVTSLSTYLPMTLLLICESTIISFLII